MAGKPRVIVAGGTGMIGRRLCRHLVRCGYAVLVLTRGEASGEDEGVNSMQWDPLAGGPWRAQLDGTFAVINLCGEIIAGRRWTESRKTSLIDSRTVPSRALVDAACAVAVPPSVFLQASGVGFYGIGDDEKTEDAPAGDDFLAQLAGEWEAPLNDLPMRHVALRFGVVLDKAGGALPQMLLPFRMFVGGTIAGGRQWFSWVHIADAVRAIEYVLTEKNLTGPINVVAPGAVRNRELTTIVGKVLHRPTLFNVPRLAMTMLLGEQATLVCDGQRVKPARLATAGFEFKFENLEPALNDLHRA